MVSGAGETAARRRRDMTISLNLYHLSLTVWFLLVSNLCVTPQKYPNLSSQVDFSGDGLLCNEGKNRCLTSSVPSKTLLPMASLNPAKEVPHQPSNASPPSLELEFIDLPSSSGSSSTFITVSHGGGDSIPGSPTTPTLDSNWMGLSSNCGPLSITWPMFQIFKEAQVSSIF